jgi:outer membrane protein OmpA-like peptidoglycan-associated protein
MIGRLKAVRQLNWAAKHRIKILLTLSHSSTLSYYHIFMKYPLLLFLLLCQTVLLPAQSVFDSLYQTKTLEVYFASGKYALDATASATLDEIVGLFKQINTDKAVRITAHTDSVGQADRNEQLARNRAAAVSQYLQKQGLPAEAIIEVKTYGERLPIAPNATEEGRQRNRRATVEVARTVPMATLTGRVTDKSTGSGVQAWVSFRSKTRKDSVQTDTSGHYRVRLPKDTVVKIEAVARDYFFESFALKVLGSPELYAKYKLSPNIALPPAKKGEKAVLRDLFFVGDAAILLKSSEGELPKVLKFMQLNPKLKIEIGGHVNVPYPKGMQYPKTKGLTPEQYVMEKEPMWKQGLSKQRAETVFSYLVQNGIDSLRMATVGYKNNQMLFPNAVTGKEQEQNRRVEIKIVE